MRAHVADGITGDLVVVDADGGHFPTQADVVDVGRQRNAEGRAVADVPAGHKSAHIDQHVFNDHVGGKRVGLSRHARGRVHLYVDRKGHTLAVVAEAAVVHTVLTVSVRHDGILHRTAGRTRIGERIRIDGLAVHARIVRRREAGDSTGDDLYVVDEVVIAVQYGHIHRDRGRFAAADDLAGGARHGDRGRFYRNGHREGRTQAVVARAVVVRFVRAPGIGRDLVDHRFDHRRVGVGQVARFDQGAVGRRIADRARYARNVRTDRDVRDQEVVAVNGCHVDRRHRRSATADGFFVCKGIVVVIDRFGSRGRFDRDGHREGRAQAVVAQDVAAVVHAVRAPGVGRNFVDHRFRTRRVGVGQCARLDQGAVGRRIADRARDACDVRIDRHIGDQVRIAVEGRHVDRRHRRIAVADRLGICIEVIVVIHRFGGRGRLHGDRYREGRA